MTVSFVPACGGGASPTVVPPSLDTGPVTSPPSTVPMPTDAIMVKNVTELTTALGNAIGGETIALASGNYGNFVISNKTYNTTVFVRPQAGATPAFKRFEVRSCKKMQIAGLSILPRIISGDVAGTAVSLSGEDIVFEKSLISWADNSDNWSAQDWKQYAFKGLIVSGNRMIVRENLIYNTSFALDSSATNSLISKNIIKGYRGDALRGLGNYTTFEYNDVRNCVQVDANHADGFQSWTVGTGGVGTGTVVGVNLIGNIFIEHENINHPLKCQLQGIGAFDGFYVDWLVANNLVVVSSYHGISFYGADNVNIINNTVISSDPIGGQIPWIMITNHKTRGPSINSLIRNNISGDVRSGAGSTADSNLIVNTAQLSTTFIDSTNFNFKLIAGSTAIDAGTTLMALALDILGITRVAPIDLGAYEFQ